VETNNCPAKLDELVTGRNSIKFAIPANPGSGPGQVPESSYFHPALGGMDPGSLLKACRDGFRRGDDPRDFLRHLQAHIFDSSANFLLRNHLAAERETLEIFFILKTVIMAQRFPS
jgi:hypothetical protein